MLEASTFDRLMRIRHVWIEALHPPLSRKRQRHEVHITDTDPDRDNGKSILQTCDISVSITGRTDAKAFTELMKSLSELVDTHRRNGQTANEAVAENILSRLASFIQRCPTATAVAA